jgi:hypothetical protein
VELNGQNKNNSRDILEENKDILWINSCKGN